VAQNRTSESTGGYNPDPLTSFTFDCLSPPLLIDTAWHGTYTFNPDNSERKVQRVRFLGLDVGSVRIGVAMSDETGLIAQGLTTLERIGWKKDLRRIVDLIRTHGVEMVVVGNPLNLDGSTGAQAEIIQDFVLRLKEASPIEVRLWDERLSSVSAERVLIEGGMQRGRRKPLIDKLAAVIFLQNFLDHRNQSPTKGLGDTE
jgi:putative Holliday junction resolvase